MSSRAGLSILVSAALMLATGFSCRDLYAQNQPAQSAAGWRGAMIWRIGRNRHIAAKKREKRKAGLGLRLSSLTTIQDRSHYNLSSHENPSKIVS